MKELIGVRAIDVAYNILKDRKEGMSFKEMWAEVKKQCGYSDAIAGKKVSQFYTDLSLDGRFISLEDNVWNLKSHCKYDEVEIQDDELDDSDGDDDENDGDESDESIFSDESSEMSEY